MNTASLHRPHAKRHTRQLFFRVSILYPVALVFGLSYAFPLLWALSTSLKAEHHIFIVPPRLIPAPVMWSNYYEAMTRVPFLRYILNTFQLAAPVMLGTVLSNALVAYGFARIKWPLREVFFSVCIATMLVPFQVTMIPVFLIFRRLGWVNTYLPLMAPAFLGSPYFIFLLRQFFLTIPSELSDAARVDGCSEWGILWRVVLPLSTPVLALVALLSFMGVWNDYLGPLIYLNRDSLYTVSIGLSRYQAYGGTSGQTDPARWALLMAASVITIIPVLVIFFFTQKTFIEGISLTGIKG